MEYFRAGIKNEPEWRDLNMSELKPRMEQKRNDEILWWTLFRIWSYGRKHHSIGKQDWCTGRRARSPHQPDWSLLEAWPGECVDDIPQTLNRTVTGTIRHYQSNKALEGGLRLEANVKWLGAVCNNIRTTGCEKFVGVMRRSRTVWWNGLYKSEWDIWLNMHFVVRNKLAWKTGIQQEKI